MKFRDYPSGFRALALIDLAYAIAALGSSIYLSVENVPFTPEDGFIIGSSWRAIITIAFVLVFWRYRIRTAGGGRRTSVSVLLLAIIILWAIPV